MLSDCLRDNPIKPRFKRNSLESWCEQFKSWENLWSRAEWRHCPLRFVVEN